MWREDIDFYFHLKELVFMFISMSSNQDNEVQAVKEGGPKGMRQNFLKTKKKMKEAFCLL